MFTDSPRRCSPPRATHRDHAIIEQVIADLKDGPLAHLPSGLFTANGAWLACAAIAYNLTRAAGALAGAFHARARTGTLRAQLITVPGPARPLRRPAHPAPARTGPGSSAWSSCSPARPAPRTA